MACILRSPSRQSSFGNSSDVDASPSTLPCSPIAASLGEYRNDFWEATITIPLHEALRELSQDVSRQRPRCLRDPYSKSPLLMSPTPESCTLTMSSRSPQSPPLPPAHETPIIEKFGSICAHPLLLPDFQLPNESDVPQVAPTRSRKRGHEALESTPSTWPTREITRLKCLRAVRNVIDLSSNEAQEEHNNNTAAITTSVLKAEEQEERQGLSDGGTLS